MGLVVGNFAIIIAVVHVQSIAMANTIFCAACAVRTVHTVQQGMCVWLHPWALMHMCTASHHITSF